MVRSEHTRNLPLLVIDGSITDRLRVITEVERSAEMTWYKFWRGRMRSELGLELVTRREWDHYWATVHDTSSEGFGGGGAPPRASPSKGTGTGKADVRSADRWNSRGWEQRSGAVGEFE